ncbi:hypothetical protein L7F22_059587 [Adiantum nelumboides]|nr:hypothetical protein [Adiantum nelumboides]
MWVRLQASSNIPNNLDLVRKLMNHPSVNIRNGANMSALGGFVDSIINFHAADGSGYKLMRDMVLQMEFVCSWQFSRLLARALSNLHRLEKGRKALAKDQLQHIASTAGISKGVLAIVSKVLEDL